MTDLMAALVRVHPAAEMHASEYVAGQLSRREFLTRTTALGLTTASAYGLLGLTPARADSHDPRLMGGTLRVQMETKTLTAPPAADWSEIANFTRGWLEYLVEYNADGSLRGMLLDGWQANDDASQFTLNVRPGVRWNNGDAFTAQDVARVIGVWCDTRLPGNSMAARMGTLIDPATGQAADGAIEVVDDLTVRLTLTAPDISIIVGMADYPAAVFHHSFVDGDPSENPIGTGPYLPTVNDVGARQVLTRNSDHAWWGTEVYGGPYLDVIEYIDYGTDPAAVLAAAEAGEIDMTYQSVGEFIDVFNAIGWQQSAAVTAATICIRCNQNSPPYDNVLLRRAMQLATSNAVVLELGYDGRGLLAENHHVCPIHPDYADIGPPDYDPVAALALLNEAGLADETFELISIDDAWVASSCDAVAAQLLDAGLNVTRRILPGSVFWSNWTTYPFSASEWNMRPLGVQTLSLAYRSGVVWNETAFADPEFDALLEEAMSIADATARSEVMARLQQILRDEGVVIQPYWRSLYRHHVAGVVGAEMHPTFEHHHYKWAYQP